VSFYIIFGSIFPGAAPSRGQMTKKRKKGRSNKKKKKHKKEKIYHDRDDSQDYADDEVEGKPRVHWFTTVRKGGE
jgi:hypothetical protein